jgi:GNAT superfamily N-acetyltransferase
MDSEPVWSKYDWWLAVDDNNKPIGFAGGHLYGPDNYYYFVRAGVAEVARGRGMQRRLIRARLRHAAKLGAAGCYTYTTLSNPASSRSLIRCGFVPFIPKRKWGGTHSIYWFRRIDRS